MLSLGSSIWGIRPWDTEGLFIGTIEVFKDCFFCLLWISTAPFWETLPWKVIGFQEISWQEYQCSFLHSSTSISDSVDVKLEGPEERVNVEIASIRHAGHISLPEKNRKALIQELIKDCRECWLTVLASASGEFIYSYLNLDNQWYRRKWKE